MCVFQIAIPDSRSKPEIVGKLSKPTQLPKPISGTMVKAEDDRLTVG